VLSRVINAAQATVFEAWTQSRDLSPWFGPAGFTMESIQGNMRGGGWWHFVMMAPRRSSMGNLNRSGVVIVSPERIVLDRGSDMDDASCRFRMTGIIDEPTDGKTVITRRQRHPTVAQRKAGLRFGAIVFGHQIQGRLSKRVEGQ
jgi:uncharacterized protein YndB with AHSA1/START domain